MKSGIRFFLALAAVSGAGCALQPTPTPKAEPAAAPKIEVAQTRVLGAPLLRVVKNEAKGDVQNLTIEVDLNMNEAKLDPTGPLQYRIEGGQVQSIVVGGDGTVQASIRRTGPGKLTVFAVRYAVGSPRNPNAVATEGDWSWSSGAGSSGRRTSTRNRRPRKGREVTVDDVWDGKTMKDSIPPH